MASRLASIHLQAPESARQEIVTSFHEPEKFILAHVEMSDGLAGEARYVRSGLDERQPPFDQDAIQSNLKRLIKRAEGPS